MIADLEKIASDFLRAHAAVDALDTRLVGKTPTETTGGTHTSWVRVTQLDASNVTNARVEHLVEYLLQFDCYAGADDDAHPTAHGQPEASRIARTIRAALFDDFPGARPGAVVTQVTITGHTRIPDTEFRPTRERVVVTAEIRAHT